MLAQRRSNERSPDHREDFLVMVMLVKYSCAFVVMPGGLGTLDELFEAATLIQCKKIGPFPLILLGRKFWRGVQIWGRHLIESWSLYEGRTRLWRITDSPKEAIELILHSLPADLRNRLKPQSQH